MALTRRRVSTPSNGSTRDGWVALIAAVLTLIVNSIPSLCERGPGIANNDCNGVRSVPGGGDLPNTDTVRRSPQECVANARCVAALAAMLLIRAPVADAQWYVAGYLGANHTMPATVSIDQPSLGTSLEFDDVTFVARPFTSPQYYGVRAGYLFGEERRWGVEFEWLHPKVYAEVEHAVHVTGRSGGVNVDTTTRMDTFVQHYAMSHGMNFMLVNVVARRPLGGTASRVALTGRAGAGPMLPHAETNVGGRSREQYERAGIGFQVAGGVDVRLAGWLSAIADYKFGHARPEIDIADGTGQMSANVHQIAFGLAFGLSR
jgi:opacity protein-like surface antigen